jgi:hypothetical protein
MGLVGSIFLSSVPREQEVIGFTKPHGLRLAPERGQHRDAPLIERSDRANRPEFSTGELEVAFAASPRVSIEAP